MTNNKPTLVFIGTYPPRECGIATFTQDLLQACQKLLGPNLNCKVAAMSLSASDTYDYPPEVEWEIDQEDIEQHKEVAEEINSNPLITGVVIQHEFGIFGGPDGKNILEFIKACNKPLLVTMHTVLPQPTEHMDEVTSKLIEKANIVVVQTKKSQEILHQRYGWAVGKIYVIPHGIHHTTFSLPHHHKKNLKLHKQTILSTFGLLSRGKGIEYVIKALPSVVNKHPEVTYLVLGQTHPVVRRNEGESYRLELLNLVKQLNLSKNVKFYDKYLSVPDLLTYLKATDIYICTSLNPNQAVSGTLSYAAGAGRAVVSTEFPQAKELITPGVGHIVPIADSDGYSKALLDLLSSRKNLKNTYRKAYVKTRSMLWSNVAHDYLRIISQISPFMMSVDPLLPPLSIKHLKNMTDKYAFLQFANGNKPAKEFGYTADDNARALVVCSWLVSRGHKNQVLPLIYKYLNFLQFCQLENGSFTNYVDAYHHKHTDQNHQENLQDANARTFWSLTEVAKNEYLSRKLRNKALKMIKNALPQIEQLTELRSRAFVIKGIQNLLEVKELDTQYLLNIVIKNADTLTDSFAKHSTKKWVWFEKSITYNNAILPESLIKAWQMTENKQYLKIAMQSLRFLVKKSFLGDVCVPVGQNGWYVKGKKKAEFDQQPEEPSALVLSLLTAFEVTGNGGFRHLAEKCFTWFLGNNILGERLYNYKTAGCYDGLSKNGVNTNQGAESLVSYLLARIALEEASQAWT